MLPPDALASCIDADGDGYGTGEGCLGPDCNDGDPTVHPGAPERCDMIDSNCDGDADLRQSDELDAWCVATASIDCGRGWPILCRHAGDELERAGFSPFASPQCMLACTIQGGTNMFIRCWRDPPSEYGTCPRPEP